MKVIWVLENIKRNFNTKDFYINSKLNIMLLLCSVNLWRKFHPEDTCVLYADDMTINLFDRLKVLDLWHNVYPIPQIGKVDKNVFWAANKVQVLSQQVEPVIIMDNDTHVYKRIKDYLDLNKVYVSNLENGKGYYPTSIDPYIQKLSYKTRWTTQAVNVSFLNLPDPLFTREYAELSLQCMEELTALKAPNPQYLIFSEQLVLKHMLEKNKVSYSSILATTWDCKKNDWGEDNNEGIWPIGKSEMYFKHYGPLKGHIKNNTNNQNYEREMKHLSNCLNFLNLDLSKIPNL